MLCETVVCGGAPADAAAAASSAAFACRSAAFCALVHAATVHLRLHQQIPQVIHLVDVHSDAH